VLAAPDGSRSFPQLPNGAPVPPPPAVGGDRPAATWSVLITHGSVPEVDLPPAAGTLGDLATATAGFRDEYYGLAPYVVDRAEADDEAFPKLVTSGLLDPLRCWWGRRPARFARRRWSAPRLDRAALAEGDPSLSGWVEARLVPKVVLATQTRVLEPAVDGAGTWVPSVPVIAVHGASGDLWRIAAVLAAPPVSAWALARFGGAALSSEAIKLSARQVLEVPVPADRRSWCAAADRLRDGGPGSLEAGAALMTRAYGAGPDVLEWWRRRLPVDPRTRSFGSPEAPGPA
jgi:hypothetical protein